MRAQPAGSHSFPFGLTLTLVVLSVGIGYAHNYYSLEGLTAVSARVQSPNATTTDLPIRIPGTDLSIMCFKVRNTTPEDDSRITAIGFDLPGSPTGFIVSFAEYLNESRAKELAARIHVGGENARVISSLRDGSNIYRVVLGPFHTREEAERAGREAGQSFWVFEGNP